ncbi:MAG: twin-arginine translocase TatA/TatE family subunit [Candidatus Nitrosothermus koennekii]|nr:MAG: twin-arginine translocase TatA/TatE family subunit [Candidatus Nitrosothermus koennekii]
MSYPLFIAGAEWLWLVVILGIVIFGAKKIPELARALGKAEGEYHKGRLEGTREINELVNSDDRLKLIKAAEILGIDYHGLSDEELRAKIREHI